MKSKSTSIQLQLIQCRYRIRMAKGYVELASLCSAMERDFDAGFFRLTAQEIMEKVEADEDLIEFLYLNKELV